MPPLSNEIQTCNLFTLSYDAYSQKETQYFYWCFGLKQKPVKSEQTSTSPDLSEMYEKMFVPYNFGIASWQTSYEIQTFHMSTSMQEKL